jgi:hypothetical protein
MNSTINCLEQFSESQFCLMPPIQLLPTAFSELFASVSHSGFLTRADRYGLMAALLEESLLDEERAALDRLLYAVRRGRLTTVDEISAIS